MFWFSALSTLPAGIYVLLAKFVLRTNTGVLGSRYIIDAGPINDKFANHSPL